MSDDERCWIDGCGQRTRPAGGICTGHERRLAAKARLADIDAAQCESLAIALVQATPCPGSAAFLAKWPNAVEVEACDIDGVLLQRYVDDDEVALIASDGADSVAVRLDANAMLKLGLALIRAAGRAKEAK